MSLSLLQTPATGSLAQSPIIFSLSESTPVYTSSSFQYVGELYYWTGSMTASGSSSNYTIVKFPNTVNVGLFDLNRIINSTLTPLAIANTSNVVYFAVDFYFQYISANTIQIAGVTRPPRFICPQTCPLKVKGRASRNDGPRRKKGESHDD